MRGLKIIHTGQRFDKFFMFAFLILSILQSFNICFLNECGIFTPKVSLQDGADSGYGAKAQEVLGQVRGRYILWS